jgi:uncharacterized membrane protein
MTKYQALRIMSVIFKVLAGLAVIISVIVALIALGSSSRFGASGLAGGFFGAVVSILYGAFVGLYLFAFAEFILVFLDIEQNTRETEENTRQTNDLLRNFLNRQP